MIFPLKYLKKYAKAGRIHRMQTNWLEVSLTVDGELAEAVADVLARFAPNGVTTQQAVDFVNDEG